MIFIVSKDLRSVEKGAQEGFVSLNLWERQNIEEWIRKAPEILGEDLLVVSVEFDRFSTSRDRLDILAVDRAGNLVVVEIKRDSMAAYADLQALRYAAMVSSMTVETLVPHYEQYLRKYNKETDLSSEDVRSRIVDFVQADSFEDFSNRPRIILCSENFSREVTATVLWLRQFGVDVSCVRFTPYRVDEKIIIAPSKIIPLPEAEQYQIEIQKKEAERAATGEGKKRVRTIQILVESGTIKGGERVYLKHALPSHVKFKKDDPIFNGTLTGKRGQSNAIRWEKDQQEYSISYLAWSIFRDLHPDKKDPGGVNGSWHWVLEDGRNLWSAAEEVRLKNQRSPLAGGPAV